jgi:hypothetical protein
LRFLNESEASPRAAEPPGIYGSLAGKPEAFRKGDGKAVRVILQVIREAAQRMCAKFTGMDRRVVSSILLLVLVISCASCGVALFKVKPVTDLPALPAESRSAEASGVTIRVAPLLTDEESQELFEANLQVSGVLPVRLELTSAAPVELKKARFHLRDSKGTEWKLVTAKKAVGLILKSNGVFAYNPNSRKQFEKEFGSYELDVKTALSAGETRRGGFLFFQTPDKRPVPSTQQLTLTVERLPQTATITIN